MPTPDFARRFSAGRLVVIAATALAVAACGDSGASPTLSVASTSASSAAATAASPQPTLTLPATTRTSSASLPSASVPATTTGSPAPTTAPGPKPSPGWGVVPDGTPVGSVAVWTGTEVLVNQSGRCAELGKAELWGYRPATQQWRAAAPSGLTTRNGTNGVWTGTTAVIAGGFGVPPGVATDPGTCDRDAGDPTPPCIGLTDGAAYEPRTDTWRRIAPMPASIADGVSFWTGTEMIVWTFRDKVVGEAYDPATDTWRTLSTRGASARHHTVSVWTGRELVVWGGDDSPDEATDGTPFADGFAYSPTTDTWRPVPTAPVPGRGTAATAWTGTEVIVWGGSTARTTAVGKGAAYDPATDTWRAIALSPLKAAWDATAVWMGRLLLVSGGATAATDSGTIGQAATYDPATDTWTMLPAAPEVHGTDANQPIPATERAGAAGFWTGTQALVVGGYTPLHNGGDAGGFTYTPA